MNFHFQHNEAFCLMQYDADDATESEVIWNSRDGVTPFIITLRSGKPATHARWGEDARITENMARALGVRWFVTATRENLHDGAVEYVEKYWDHPEYPMHPRWATKEEAVENLLDMWLEQPGSPTLVDAPPGDIDRQVKVSKFAPTS